MGLERFSGILPALWWHSVQRRVRLLPPKLLHLVGVPLLVQSGAESWVFPLDCEREDGYSHVPQLLESYH
jgi:hypothetical protein